MQVRIMILETVIIRELGLGHHLRKSMEERVIPLQAKRVGSKQI